MKYLKKYEAYNIKDIDNILDKIFVGGKESLSKGELSYLSDPENIEYKPLTQKEKSELKNKMDAALQKTKMWWTKENGGLFGWKRVYIDALLKIAKKSVVDGYDVSSYVYDEVFKKLKEFDPEDEQQWVMRWINAQIYFFDHFNIDANERKYKFLNWQSV